MGSWMEIVGRPFFEWMWHFVEIMYTTGRGNSIASIEMAICMIRQAIQYLYSSRSDFIFVHNQQSDVNSHFVCLMLGIILFGRYFCSILAIFFNCSNPYQFDRTNWQNKSSPDIFICHGDKPINSYHTLTHTNISVCSRGPANFRVVFVAI